MFVCSTPQRDAVSVANKTFVCGGSDISGQEDFSVTQINVVDVPSYTQAAWR